MRWTKGQLDDLAPEADKSLVEHLHWIALVDDDVFVLRALARLLRTRGLHSRTFSSAGDFLSALADSRPQCLILDLQMPEMSGLEVQHTLSRLDVEIPTIIITAHRDVRTRERCEAAGCVAFLEKPLQAGALFAAIQKACPEQRSEA